MLIMVFDFGTNFFDINHIKHKFIEKSNVMSRNSILISISLDRREFFFVTTLGFHSITSSEQ